MLSPSLFNLNLKTDESSHDDGGVGVGAEGVGAVGVGAVGVGAEGVGAVGVGAVGVGAVGVGAVGVGAGAFEGEEEITLAVGLFVGEDDDATGAAVGEAGFAVGILYSV